MHHHVHTLSSFVFFFFFCVRSTSDLGFSFVFCFLGSVGSGGVSGVPGLVGFGGEEERGGGILLLESGIFYLRWVLFRVVAFGSGE